MSFITEKNFKFNNNWLNTETRVIFDKLSFNDYFIAGNCIANAIEGISLQGDLNFWIMSKDKIIPTLKEFLPHYEFIDLYPSMLKLYNKSDSKLAEINLIYTNMTDIEATVSCFDFDYCRCLWTPKLGLKYAKNCKRSIKSKNIRFPKYVINKRILKAIKYGYCFNDFFWQEHTDLLKIKPDIPNGSFIEVELDDLNKIKFDLNKLEINITDISDVKKCLLEIENCLRKTINRNDYDIPALLKFNSSNIGYINKYIQEIIENNPLADGHFSSIKINFWISIPNDMAHINNSNCKEYLSEKISINNNIMSGKTKMLLDNEDDFNEPPRIKKSSSIIKVSTSSAVEIMKVKPTASQTVNPSTHLITFDNFKNERCIPLNELGTAYLLVSYIPEYLKKYAIKCFESMWNLHPADKHKIIMYEKEVEVHRYSQSYLNTYNDLKHIKSSSYMYSGFNTSNNNMEIPDLFSVFYEYMISLDNKYNQMIANWYEDKNDYIAQHSDCQRGMIDNPKITILSLYNDIDNTKYRVLSLKSKNKDKEYNIRLDHGLIFSMCGTTQNEFTHGISKCETDVSKRISLSFRQME